MNDSKIIRISMCGECPYAKRIITSECSDVRLHDYFCVLKFNRDDMKSISLTTINEMPDWCPLENFNDKE